MRVLADFHHAALYHSLHLLFEKRLGWELYRPIGTEWYPDFWRVYDHPSTVAQFLGLHQAETCLTDIRGIPLPKSQYLNLQFIFEDGIYYIKDLGYGTIHRAVTLEKFKDMQFDIIISSIPQHVPLFNNLIKQFKPRAKHIFQVGNSWTSSLNIKNILASTTSIPAQQGLNLCTYHQEFDLNTFIYKPPYSHNVMNSYIHFMSNPELLDLYHSSLPEWKITKYGAGMEDSLQFLEEIAETMRESAFTWHYKPGGDGYGHVIFSSYACGRPAVLDCSFYSGKLAEPLLIDGTTCLDISRRSFSENISLLERFSKPEEHTRICERAYQQFCSIVNFDEEFEYKIKPFLQRLR